MKQLVYVAGFVAMVACVNAQMIDLTSETGAAITTGELIDEVRDLGVTTNVVEIAGLKISARSGASNQKINALAKSCGIDSDGSGDDSSHLEAGEKLILSFDRDIQINRLDFNHVTAGESITVTIAGTNVWEIVDLEMSNRISDYMDTNMVVSANSEIEFYTTGTSMVGIDGIDVTVLGGSAPGLSITETNGVRSVMATFEGAASGTYALQYSTDLTSNEWNTVSAPFSTNASWLVDATNSSGFYRIIQN